jgi:DNA-binding transcriptional ArsR family regulator
MEVTEVLRSLERNKGVFPREAVEAAMDMRDEITPALLEILEHTIDRAGEIVTEDKDGTYFAHLFAMYLLAQFRETRAYPLMVRFARVEEDRLDELTGEFVTEDLCRVLASVCDGDTELIEQLIVDESVGEYVRSAALRSLLVLVAAGDKTREEVMAYFKCLFEGRLERSYSHAWDTLVACATDLHPEEVSGHIAAAFEEGLVDRQFISPRGVERALKTDKESVLKNLRREGGYIENVVYDMGGWACFKKSHRIKRPAMPAARLASQMEQAARSQPYLAFKVNPNASCPCGSGRKYKKCCGRIA